jgi:hypothetical protein
MGAGDGQPGGPWVIPHPIADLPVLCEGLRRRLLGSAAAVVVCDVRALPADLPTVDALARLELTARRLGREIRLAGASPELLGLLGLAGLAGVVGRATPPPASPRGRTGETAERYPGSS